MLKEEYIKQARDILNTYAPVKNNPNPSLEDRTKALMKKTLAKKFSDDHLRRLLLKHCRTAELYGLPKTPKLGNPLRPVVSACGDPLDKLPWLIQCIVTQILRSPQLT